MPLYIPFLHTKEFSDPQIENKKKLHQAFFKNNTKKC